MAELVVDVRLGDGHEGQEGDACDESRRADGQHCQRPPPRQAAQHALHGLEPRRGESGSHQRHGYGRRKQDSFEHPGWQGSLQNG